jgi:hypothetical protein|tara:strand:- start:625 stop:810 length:186 start_codon:yes stop_codon:yes gene_type:complete
MRRPLSTSFIDTYCRLPRRNQDHTIGSFQAELAALDEDLDKEEIRITQETIETLTALRNAD